MEKISLSPIFEQFLGTLTAITARGRRWPLHLLDILIREKGYSGPFEIPSADLFDRFVQFRKNHKDSTASMLKAGWLAFYRWAMDEGLTKVNPALRLNRLKLHIWYVPSPLDEQEKKRFISSLTYMDYSEARISCAIILGIHEGLRVGEVCNLRWENVDLEDGELIFVGKGSRPARLPLTPTARTALLRLRDLQENQFGDRRLVPVPWVFASIRYPLRKPNSRHFQQAFKERALECKITRPVRFHNSRHTFITAMAEACEGDLFTFTANARLDPITAMKHYIAVSPKRRREVLIRASR